LLIKYQPENGLSEVVFSLKVKRNEGNETKFINKENGNFKNTDAATQSVEQTLYKPMMYIKIKTVVTLTDS